MISRLIEVSGRNPVLVFLVVAMLAVGGAVSARRAPLDAIPDLSDVQVVVVTPWEGRSPDVIEDQITYPLSAALVAAPGVEVVRGQSGFGLSFVTVIFDEDTSLQDARVRVLERLSSSRVRLPEAVKPGLGPDATGLGWVFQYALVDETGRTDLAELRTLQDWQLRFALESVHGVAEVATVGGFTRELQVLLDPARLRAYGVSIMDVTTAVKAATGDAGGHVLELAGHEHMIRARAQATSPEDVASAVVMLQGDQGSVPIRIGDVAEVAVGPAPRRGIAELDGRGEVVGGIVIMRQGENALDVIDAVKQRISELRLPEGVKLVTVYDRSELIEASVATLRTALLEEMFVVALIVLVFLRRPRSILVPIVSLPLAVLIAFIPLKLQGLTVNLMSLGGIAVAIGEMVDASIVLVENVHKKLEGRGDVKGEERLRLVLSAMQEVGSSIFFSLLVMTISFVPVLSLQGQEGRLFAPLAWTKSWSMLVGALLCVTLTPALVALLIRGGGKKDEDDPLNRLLVRLYSPVVRFVVRQRFLVLLTAFAVVGATIPAWRALEEELMPPLDEGVLLYMPTAPPGMSAGTAADVVRRMDAELKTFPEVATVFGKMGRAETATDPAPLGMAEITITLKPREEWRPGMTRQKLVEEMDLKLRYPGMPNLFWMPIQTRTEMLSTGVRSPVAAQLVGDNLDELERAAAELEGVLRLVPGTRSAVAERQGGGFIVDIRVRRDDAARLGLSIADVNEAVSTAVGGMSVAQVIEGRSRYDLTVRIPREWRDDPDELGDLLLASRLRDDAGATPIPLREVADIVLSTGPDMVKSEDGNLVVNIFIDTDRPVGSWVRDAAVATKSVQLPPGARLQWAGQVEHLETARARLLVVVPMVLALITLLLYLSTRSLVGTAIVLLAVPFSLVGAVWLLWALDYNMSVAVWVGFIALMGLDAETGAVMLLYLTLAHDRRVADGSLRSAKDLEDVIVEGAAHRVRPKLMTVLTTMIGLVPLLWSDGTGADVMKRIAAPMVGGLITSFALELCVYPALFAIWKRRTELPAGENPRSDSK